MNIKFTLVTFSLFIATLATAQNVGIGTNSPGTKLDVSGGVTYRETSIAIASNAATIPSNVSEVQLTGTATATITVTAPSAPPNAGQHLIIYNNTAGGYGATYAGTTIPAGTATEFIYTNTPGSSSTFTWVATSPATSGSGAYIQNQTTTQANANFNIQSAGAAKVGGVIEAAASQTADLLDFENSSGTVLTEVTAGGNVGIGVPSPLTALEVAGANNSNSSIKAGSMEIQNFALNNTSFMDNTYYLNSASSNKYRAAGYATQMQFANGDVMVNTAPSGTAGANATMTTRMIIKNTGNTGIGIGSSTPGAKLHVYTTTNADGILVDGPAATSLGYLLAIAGTQKASLALAGNAGDWTSGASVGDLVIRDVSQKILFNTNGGAAISTMSISGSTVGIGITTPGGTLDVEGGTAAASTAGVPIKLIAQNGGATGGNAGGNITITAGTAGGTTAAAGGSIVLTPGAAIASGAPGYVGVNTTAPHTMLDVSGALTLRDTIITTAATTTVVLNNYHSQFQLNTGATGAFNITPPTPFTTTNGGQSMVIYNKSGYTGTLVSTVSTAIPTGVATEFVYSVAGGWIPTAPASTGSGSYWATNGNIGTSASTSTVGSTVNNNFIGTTDAKDFVLASNNLEHMRITSGGSVGIGTSTPAGALQIMGNYTCCTSGSSSPNYDIPNRVYITNTSSDYGRTNLILTGRIQSGNDAWSFGSNARNSIVFAENAATSGNNIGATGTEQYSIQLNGVAPSGGTAYSLGFLSTTNGNTPVMAMQQNGSIAINAVAPNASAVLDINSTTQGFLPPRMSAPNTAISSPAEGLIAYNTTDHALYMYNGTVWQRFVMFQAPGTQSYTSAGSYTWVVPDGMTSITIDMQGGVGGSSAYNGASGGQGGRIQTTMQVIGGEVLYIGVGGAGTSGSGTTGGGGGNGGYGNDSYGGAGGAGQNSQGVAGGGGGGATDIRIGGTAQSNRILVAGGGGGGGNDQSTYYNGSAGGNGGSGATSGVMAGANGAYLVQASDAGQGGTTSGPGATTTGYYSSSCPYGQHTGTGGSGSTGGGGGWDGAYLSGGYCYYEGSGGGGAGGYYGGGGGASGGGGGGSSYIVGTTYTYNGTPYTLSSTSTSTGNNGTSGNGYVTITWQ